MPKVAVVLAGCGRMDGSEVHESTLSLLYLAQAGAGYQCFAPDAPQTRVIDHVTNVEQYDSRNQLIEAARIARGDVLPLAQADASQFDAMVIPGGSGAFENLSVGPGDLEPDLRRLILAMADAGKPIAAICIAPVLVARALGDRGIELTIGNDARTAAAIERTGARHVACSAQNHHADEKHKIVTTPAYMLGPGIAEVAAGIEGCIATLLGWCA